MSATRLVVPLPASEGFTIAREGVPRDHSGSPAVAIAVIDGPYDALGLSNILARPPISLANGACCGLRAGSACEHGTFIIGLLGARRDAPVPGLCPDAKLYHIPLFSDDGTNDVDVSALASAIELAVNAGARLINLSLGVLGDDRDFHAALGSALDRAYAAGSVIVAAAGNQGRLARGQLVSHPATTPVVAVDAQGELLPSSNLSPEIARRGVAMLGSDILGYGLGGKLTRMTGTSAAAALATGVLAAIFGSRSNATVSHVRAAVARLGPRGGAVPPTLDSAQIIAALDAPARAQNGMRTEERRPIRAEDHRKLGGDPIMQTNGDTRSLCGARPTVTAGRPTLALAGEAGERACGASGGVCTCNGNQTAHSGFVYAIGTIEAEYPNVAIEREMQVMAHALGVEIEPHPHMLMKPTEDRRWQYAVLNADRKKTRYIARQLSWRLTIEDFPVFVLKPQDPSDLDELIDRLNRPKYPNGDSGKEEGGGKKQAGGNKERKGSISLNAPSGPPQDLDVVVGARGAQTPDGIEVLVDQIFAIDPEQLAPRGLKVFAQLSDNYGLTDADRAYNFLAARYTIARENLDEMEKYGLVGVPIISSRLSGDAGRVVRVIFTVRGIITSGDAETPGDTKTPRRANTPRGISMPIEKKYFVRVDVTHKFPVIVNPWQPYLERGEAS